MTLKVGMQHRVLKFYQVCSNDGPGWTLTYLRQGLIWSIVLLYAKTVKHGFFRHYCCLWCQSWQMQLTKWVHKPVWISKVSVIDWPWSKVTQIQHLQTSFPKIRLGGLKPNFIWSLNGMGEQTFVQMVQVTWPMWPPCPYMLKTLKNLLLRNRKADDHESWYAASGTLVLPSLFKWWPKLTLTYFTARPNLVPYAFVWEKVNNGFFRNYNYSLSYKSW